MYAVSTNTSVSNVQNPTTRKAQEEEKLFVLRIL